MLLHMSKILSAHTAAAQRYRLPKLDLNLRLQIADVAAVKGYACFPNYRIALGIVGRNEAHAAVLNI